MYPLASAVDLLDRAVWGTARISMKTTGLGCQKRVGLRRQADLGLWKDIMGAPDYGGSRRSSHFPQASGYQ